MWPFDRGPKPVLDRALGDPTGRRLIDAGTRGDWQTIREVLHATTDPDDRACHVDVCIPDEGAEPAWLTAWAEAEPRAALPTVLRARHRISG
jgi:hypothetical protein